jgi:hypothetical protein
MIRKKATAAPTPVRDGFAGGGGAESKTIDAA